MVDLPGTIGERILALVAVILLAAIGGIVMQVLFFGLDIKSGKVGPYNFKPITSKLTVPPMVGMIIVGCLVRNYECVGYMQYYPDYYASWIRAICLSIILLRAGLELDFRGKGIGVVKLTFIPQQFEVVFAALATRWLFEFPWPLCFAQGYILGAVAPAIVVPCCMGLIRNQYGVKKGICATLIASSPFDDIVAIILFGICLTITF